MNDAVVVVEVEHERFDVESALWLVFWRRRSWVWIVAAAVAVAFVTARQAAWPVGVLVGLSVLLLGIVFVFFSISGRAQHAAAILERCKPFTYRVSAGALEVETSALSGVARWPWSAWIGAFDNDRVIVVHRIGPPLIIPKRQVPPTALAELIAILKVALPGRAHFLKESTS